MAIELCLVLTDAFTGNSCVRAVNYFVVLYKHTHTHTVSMATIFSSPEIGDPRAVGVKNGGVKEFTSDIIYPVSRITDKDFTVSKQLEFRWRSDSSRFWSP